MAPFMCKDTYYRLHTQTPSAGYTKKVRVMQLCSCSSAMSIRLLKNDKKMDMVRVFFVCSDTHRLHKRLASLDTCNSASILPLPSQVLYNATGRIKGEGTSDVAFKNKWGMTV